MINREMSFRIRQNPHNDLEGLAAYHVNTIRVKLQSGDHGGIALDCISAAIAIAFLNEAVLNFVGLRVFKESWIERALFAKKVETLSQKLKFEFDKTAEPFRTVETLRKARNELAHGKPVAFDAQATTNKELAAKMRPAWGLVDDPETVLAYFENARAFKQLLFAKAKIKWATSLTSAFGGG